MNTKELIELQEDIISSIINSEGFIDQELENAKDMNDLAVRQKVDGGYLADKVMEAKAKNLEELADYYYAEAMKIEKARQRYLTYMKTLMVSKGIKELKGDRFRFVVNPTLERLVIDKEEEIPKFFFNSFVLEEVDKDAVKKALLNHEEVPGAHLEGGFKINKYVNK